MYSDQNKSREKKLNKKILSKRKIENPSFSNFLFFKIKLINIT